MTEQIDAIEASAVDPYRYLVAPRILACTLMVPLLTIAADFFGILTGWVANTLIEPTSLALYVAEGFKHLEFSDLLPETVRTSVFGLLIALIGCFQGMRTRGGTEGVGQATTRTVVVTSIAILVADLFLTKISILLFPSR